MARGLVTQTVKKFRGLNLMTAQSNLGPEWAQDCMNVLPSASGGLEKLRVPVAKSLSYDDLKSPGNFANFQNATGVRQVVVQSGNFLYEFALDAYTAGVIDDDVLNSGVMSFCQSNNIMFMANGQRMMKWTGTNFWNWGIAKPVAPSAALWGGAIEDPDWAPGVSVLETSGSGAPEPGDPVYSERTFYVAFSFVNAGGFETAASPVAGPITVPAYDSGTGHYSVLQIYWMGTGFDTANQGTPRHAWPENAVGVNLYVGSTADNLARVNFAPVPSGIFKAVAGIGDLLMAFTGGWLSECGVHVGALYHSPGIGEWSPTWYERMFEEPRPESFNYRAETPPTVNQTSALEPTVEEGELVLTVGRKYRYAYGNSVTGHIGAASDPTANSGPVEDGVVLVLPAPTDPQCDQIWLFATKDGGSDYYLNLNPDTEDGSWACVAGGSAIAVVDTTPDDDLDQSRIAPILNEPPPVGSYLTKYQGRIFIGCLENEKQSLAFSGYERVLLGRPEESFPPNNRIRLAIGADEIRGIGAIPGGVVAFSKSNEMFAFKGNPEDITTDAPLAYSAFLEELRWGIGCMSHWSIAATPIGLIWLGSDMVLKCWNGTDKPVDMSCLQHPFFASITPAQAQNARGLYWSYLEKNFYLLAVPIKEASRLNRILVVDLNQSEEENFGAVPLAIGDIEAMDVVEDSSGVRHLLILQDGTLKELKLASTAVNGLSLVGSAK